MNMLHQNKTNSSKKIQRPIMSWKVQLEGVKVETGIEGVFISMMNKISTKSKIEIELIRIMKEIK